MSSRHGTGYLVTCEDPNCPWPLSRTVETITHANNLEAKHNREVHPPDDLAELVEILSRPHADRLEQAQAILAAGYVRPPM